MYKLLCLILGLLMVLSTGILRAQEETAEKNAAVEVITYPAKVIKEGAEVTLEAGKNVVKTVGGTAEGIVEGDMEKAVTTPIKGTGETLVDAAEGTVTAPIDAAREEGDEIHQEDLPK